MGLKLLGWCDGVEMGVRGYYVVKAQVQFDTAFCSIVKGVGKWTEMMNGAVLHLTASLCRRALGQGLS